MAAKKTSQKGSKKKSTAKKTKVKSVVSVQKPVEMEKSVDEVIEKAFTSSKAKSPTEGDECPTCEQEICKCEEKGEENPKGFKFLFILIVILGTIAVLAYFPLNDPNLFLLLGVFWVVMFVLGYLSFKKE